MIKPFRVLLESNPERFKDFFFFRDYGRCKDVFQDIILGCVNMWPLLTICLLLSLIAGFIVWILDTWDNSAQFPRPFPHGLVEGFWWSVVSMTTVGYGDKSPKSFPARMFAIFWIIIGITVTSIYIASLASQVNTTHASYYDI